jgi:hypothetical protein
MRHLLQQLHDWECMEVVDLRAEVEDDVFSSYRASPAARGEGAAAVDFSLGFDCEVADDVLSDFRASPAARG